MRVVCLITLLASVQGFLPHQRTPASLILKASTTATTVPSSSSTWQEDVDQILNVDTACDVRKSLVQGIVSKVNDITTDVLSAVQEQNVEKIAPRNLAYGKAVRGLQAFQNQIFSDIIPDLFTKGVPKLVDEGPKIINTLVEKGASELSAEILEKSQKTISQAREIAQDPSRLQSTVDELRRELRNVVRSTPEGLEVIQSINTQ